MAEALDVQVSTLKMAEKVADLRDRQLFVRVDFLGFVSELSNGVSLSSYVSTHPVGFSAHLRVGNGHKIGEGELSLAVMIEDSCNVLRQDVELLGDGGKIIATAVVD
eukprot:gene24859-26798_t